MAQLKVEYIEAYEKYSNGKTMHTPHLAARFYFNRKALLCDVSPWTSQRQLHPSWRGDRNQGQPKVINASFTIEGQFLNIKLVRTVVVHLDMESRAPCIVNADHSMASSNLQSDEHRSPQE